VDEILIDRNAIDRRVGELAYEIGRDLQREAGSEAPEIAIVTVLTGGLFFLADLVRRMTLPMRVRLITVSSYPGAAIQSQGPALRDQVPDNLGGQRVLVVDDILDSGRTIAFVRECIAAQNPASLRFCALLRKERAEPPVDEADYVGFSIPDRFVVGYGLDHDGYHRNLPDIATLRGF
jgi:hypoxanthine phosphoribosyltransferase